MSVWVPGPKFTELLAPQLPNGVEVIFFGTDGPLLVVFVRRITDNKTLYRKLYFSQDGAYWGAMQLSVDELEVGLNGMLRLVNKFLGKEMS